MVTRDLVVLLALFVLRCVGTLNTLSFVLLVAATFAQKYVPYSSVGKRAPLLQWIERLRDDGGNPSVVSAQLVSPIITAPRTAIIASRDSHERLKRKLLEELFPGKSASEYPSFASTPASTSEENAKIE